MDSIPILGIVLLILGIAFYFLPCVIADARDAGHQGAIFFINLLFGWTILGWIAALIWAVVEQPKIKTIAYQAPVADLPPLYPERTAPHQEKPWSEPFYKN